MPLDRKYKVKGTKDFLVIAGIFFFLCLWSVKDAWYPSPKVMKKHPLAIEASFAVAGSLAQILVQEGDQIGEKQILAELRKTVQESEFEKAKEQYSEVKAEYQQVDDAIRKAVKDKQSGQVAELKARREKLNAVMEAALENANAARATVAAMDLKSPSKGVVKKIIHKNFTQVDAGEAVLIIDPQDHFYLFNKSLAILSFILFWVFISVHIVIR
ncbi:MAG: hypothetical protein K9M45_08060 [Kiritimatiellales bacterium]|nr:hypothetical protein [Kiritimatiellales bacterium]